MLARARSSCLVGVEARNIDVEVHLGKGLPGFDIVGLPETAVRESRVRVRAALINSGFELPPRRVVISLAPADLKKRGAALDLAIAVALLSAAGSCAPNRLDETLLLGELSLGGELRSTRGLLAQLSSAAKSGIRSAIVPLSQMQEAALVDGIDARGAHDLRAAVAFLGGEVELPRPRAVAPASDACHLDTIADFRDVAGQASAKRGLEIAAAGRHHVLLIGPPGTGKTMLARRLPGILPPPTRAEALEIATIASASGLPVPWPIVRPFRAPHHTASAVSLIGGGDPIRPGEVTLAHGGVLFLDELPEFGRTSIEVFRTVMELGRAVVTRTRERVDMPAAPIVIAAMNPCPCGFSGSKHHLCSCAPGRVAAYRSRVSGPILDRFDLHVVLPRVDPRTLRSARPEEPSATIRARVTSARAKLVDDKIPARSFDAKTVIEELEPAAQRVIYDAVDALGMSLRGFAGAVRVARTIAALEGTSRVEPSHVAEAIGFRVLDREHELRGGDGLHAANRR